MGMIDLKTAARKATARKMTGRRADSPLMAPYVGRLRQSGGTPAAAIFNSV
jgi:hypothetical protein